jgi:hypothetical protein
MRWVGLALLPLTMSACAPIAPLVAVRIVSEVTRTAVVIGAAADGRRSGQTQELAIGPITQEERDRETRAIERERWNRDRRSFDLVMEETNLVWAGPQRRDDVLRLHSAVEEVDPASCWGKGELAVFAAWPSRSREWPPPTGTARVTYLPTGTVSEVDITPPRVGFVDRPCMERLYRATLVSPFEGDPIVVTTSFFTYHPEQPDDPGGA